MTEDEKDTKNGHGDIYRKELEAETRLEEIGVIQPPDGGQGWIVVFASFLANAVVDGIIFSIGETILPIWEKEFDSNTATVSIATSLLAGSYLLSGPVASALANHFGCNYVAIAGAIIAAIGFFATALMPALPVIYFTFGIVGGVGFGLIFLPAVVIVGQYFSNKRALATGIAVCGSGIGTAFFSRVNPLILDLYGGKWRFFMFTIAGITCLCCIFGYFFKPLQPTGAQIKEVAEIAKEFIEARNAEEHGPDYVEVVDDSNTYIASGTVIQRLPHLSQSQIHGINPATPFLSTLSLNAGDNEKKIWSNENLSLEVTRKSLSALNRPLSKPDIFYPGSTQKLNLPVERNDRNGTHVSHRASQLMLSTAALPTTESYATGNWSEGIISALKLLFDFELLYSPTFHVLAISGFLTLTCFFVPFMFLSKLAIANGVQADLAGKYLLMSLGGVNVVGRIICGYISDHPKVDPLWVTNFSLIIAGIATMIVPWATEFWQFLVYCAIFATGVACFAALRSIIVVELFGLERLTSAFGILLLYMGVAAFVGPPFAAYLKTQTNSFTLSFIVMGSLMMTSGLIAVPLRLINTWEQKKTTNSTAEKAISVELRPLNSEENA